MLLILLNNSISSRRVLGPIFPLKAAWFRPALFSTLAHQSPSNHRSADLTEGASFAASRKCFLRELTAPVSFSAGAAGGCCCDLLPTVHKHTSVSLFDAVFIEVLHLRLLAAEEKHIPFSDGLSGHGSAGQGAAWQLVAQHGAVPVPDRHFKTHLRGFAGPDPPAALL